MKDGAIDFLTKPVDADALLDAVQRSVAIDHACRARVAGDHALAAALDTLTPREREMLPYLVAGRLNKQGASDFGVVEKTVKVHRGRVMFKFGTRSLVHLVRIAERLHIEPKGVGSRRLPTTLAGQVADFTMELRRSHRALLHRVASPLCAVVCPTACVMTQQVRTSPLGDSSVSAAEAWPAQDGDARLP